MAVEVKIEGFDVLKKRLLEIVPAARKRVLRNALAAGARLVRNAAKSIRASDHKTGEFKRGFNKYRKSFTVRNAISVRTSKVARRQGNVGVFVNVRPIPNAERSAKNPSDPFYWRFIEFGTRYQQRRPFLQPTQSQFPAALEIFKTQFGRWLDKIDKTSRVDP